MEKSNDTLQERAFSNLDPAQYLKKSIVIDGNQIFLSYREFQCLELLAHGKRTKEIARYLQISVRTVEGYVQIIKQKAMPVFRGAIVDLYWHHFRLDSSYLFCTINNLARQGVGC
jgi:FixJ family two-component response regulator